MRVTYLVFYANSEIAVVFDDQAFCHDPLPSNSDNSVNCVFDDPPFFQNGLFVRSVLEAIGTVLLRIHIEEAFKNPNSKPRAILIHAD